ncbi:MAG TPA: carbohydrate ABC transporter permease [Patescibacteria group bacterium]|nr:carbohydrate ABC transporter permease [Patescibacteria group bacterium]
MSTIRWSRVAINLTVLVLVIIWTVPTLGLFITSFRDKEAIFDSGWWAAFTDPQGALTLSNYEQVLFGGDGLANAFLNTLAVTVPAVVIPILIAAFAAYGFAWMTFPGRRILFITVVALLVVPLQIALIPVLRAYLAIDLNGTFLAVWLAHAGFGLALATYLLYNYISQLPKDLLESAALDGASHFTTFRTIILPLSMPALASFAIFQFLWVWNDLLVASTFLGTDREVQVMTQALVSMTGSRGQDWQLLTAGAFVSMIVPVLVFLGLQRYFVRGMLAGSVKG